MHKDSSSPPLRITAKLVEVLFTRKGFLICNMATAHRFGDIQPVRYVFSQVRTPFTPGSHFHLTGNVEIHPEYGPQFKVVTFQPFSPLAAALVNGEIPSIGAETGLRIWDLLGEGVEQLSTANILETLSGIGPKRAQSILANITIFKAQISKS